MGSSEMEKSGKEKEPKTPQPSSSSTPPATSQEPSSAVSAGMATSDWSRFQVSVRFDHPTRVEKKVYKQLFSTVQEEFESYLNSGKLLKKADRLDLLLTRLMQIIVHRDIVDFSGDCNQCLRESKHAVVLPCNHLFCRHCLLATCNLKASANMCPTCSFSLYSTNLVLSSSLKKKKKKIKEEDKHKKKKEVKEARKQKLHTTKLAALREELQFMLDYDSTATCVVLTHFASFLSYIDRSLTEFGITSRILSSSNLDDSAQAFLTTFDEASSYNLSSASHVFVMDHAWNATDDEAQRIVNNSLLTKPCKVTHLVTKETIEEKLWSMQNFCRTSDHLTEDKMSFLFGH